jgi:anti-sigma factor RsiW
VSAGRSMHEELRDDLAAYALGALQGEEAAAVAEHLAGCEPCRSYVRWLRPAVDVLPASVEQMEPPARLRESLMANVRAEAGAAAEADGPQAGAARPPRRRSGWRDLVLRPATGLAAVAVLAAGVVAGLVIGSSGEERSFVEAQPLASVPPGAVAATLEHGAGGDAILHVERMPAPERGDVYQAWISRGGTVEPSASFRPASDGTYDAALGDSLEGADAVLVTEEPRPGLEQPTSEPVLRASLD